MMQAEMDDYDLRAFDRLFNKTAILDNGCWEFTGFRNKEWNQGKFYYRGKQHLASRIAYLLTKGDIDEGIQVLHTCDDASCINPNHLFLGTPQDNMTDKVNKGRCLLGIDHPRAFLTEKHVLEIRALANELSRQDLAAEFGVSVSTIKNIVTRVSWRHL